MKAPDKVAASQCRADIAHLAGRLNELSEKLVSSRSLVKGTIYENKKKCGNPVCRCAKGGALHTTRLLSFSHQGKTRIISLGKYSDLKLLSLEKQVQDYQNFRKARAEIVESMASVLKKINELEQWIRVDIKSTRKGGKDD